MGSGIWQFRLVWTPWLTVWIWAHNLLADKCSDFFKQKFDMVSSVASFQIYSLPLSILEVWSLFLKDFHRRPFVQTQSILTSGKEWHFHDKDETSMKFKGFLPHFNFYFILSLIILTSTLYSIGVVYPMGIGLWSWVAWFKSRLFHLPAVWLWVQCLTSLNVLFLICETSVITALLHKTLMGFKWDNTCKWFGPMSNT